MNHCKDQKFFMIFFQFAQFERQIFQKKKDSNSKAKTKRIFFFDVRIYSKWKKESKFFEIHKIRNQYLLRELTFLLEEFD